MKKLTALLAALTLALTLLFLLLFAGQAKVSTFHAAGTFENFTFSNTFDNQFTANTFSTFEAKAFDSFAVTDFDGQFQA